MVCLRIFSLSFASHAHFLRDREFFVMMELARLHSNFHGRPDTGNPATFCSVVASPAAFDLP
jgi:hypothetical protein